MTTNTGTARTTSEYQYLNSTRHFHAFQDSALVPSSETRVMVRGEGMYLWDSNGKRYLDGMSGLFCTAVGYGRHELIDAAARQMRELPYSNMVYNTTHPSVVDLSNKLFALLPEKYSRVVYTNDGSEANEVLIRTVRHFWKVMGKPEKSVLISRWNSYHGSTMGSASLGGFPFMHDMGGLPIPGIEHIGEPYWYGYRGDLTEEEFGLQAARELEAKILALGADRVAAFVAEPIQGAGGVIFPPSTYWPEIQRICRQYDVLLCADEVMTGFGRSGEWFASGLLGIEPDTISIAKALTSGYVPMGGLILSRRIGEALAERGGVYGHGLTYQGHPVAAAVALANLTLLDEGGIVAGVRSDTGPYLQSLLRDTFAGHPMIGQVQGAGALAALQFALSRKTRTRFPLEEAMSMHCMAMGLEEGIIFRPVKGRIVIAPALIATRGEIDELVEKLKRAVDATAKAVGIL